MGRLIIIFSNSYLYIIFPHSWLILAIKSLADHIFLKASVSTSNRLYGLYFLEHVFCFVEYLTEVATDKYFHHKRSSWCEEFFCDFQNLQAEHRTVILVVISSSCCFWCDIRSDELKSSLIIDSPCFVCSCFCLVDFCEIFSDFLMGISCHHVTNQSCDMFLREFIDFLEIYPEDSSIFTHNL